MKGGRCRRYLLDCDGTVDAQMNDGLGGRWFLCRVKEGKRASFNSYSDIRDTELKNVRNTGVLLPPVLPVGLYFDYLPWHFSALEADYLLGRRGFAGWDGRPFNAGLHLRSLPGLVCLCL